MGTRRGGVSIAGMGERRKGVKWGTRGKHCGNAIDRCDKKLIKSVAARAWQDGGRAGGAASIAGEVTG